MARSAAARSLRGVAAPGSAELRDDYERRYAGGGAEGRRYARWRALCAEGKADHVAALVRHLPAAPDASWRWAAATA